ncbi:MAG TPA: TlpA disulfide reductase family protein [Rubrivivax sp.]|nr:TlpA family protein disulfide reductase [Burkholderiales bacterium]HNU10468.1 TlpA disulfide reductase family protein [Rubrivivax sp.]
MSRRQLLMLGSAGAVAALAGVGLASWRLRLAPAQIDENLWTQRFERPDGGELTLSAFRGQPLIVNFWATWCPPCLQEMPDLDRLQAAYAQSGLQIVGLAVEDAAPVRKFLAERPVRFAIGVAGPAGVSLARRLGNDRGGLPFTVVFDGRGELRHRKLGQTSYAELEGWIRKL